MMLAQNKAKYSLVRIAVPATCALGIVGAASFHLRLNHRHPYYTDAYKLVQNDQRLLSRIGEPYAISKLTSGTIDSSQPRFGRCNFKVYCMSGTATVYASGVREDREEFDDDDEESDTTAPNVFKRMWKRISRTADIFSGSKDNNWELATVFAVITPSDSKKLIIPMFGKPQNNPDFNAIRGDGLKTLRGIQLVHKVFWSFCLLIGSFSLTKKGAALYIDYHKRNRTVIDRLIQGHPDIRKMLGSNLVAKGEPNGLVTETFINCIVTIENNVGPASWRLIATRKDVNHPFDYIQSSLKVGDTSYTIPAWSPAKRFHRH